MQQQHHQGHHQGMPEYGMPQGMHGYPMDQQRMGGMEQGGSDHPQMMHGDMQHGMHHQQMHGQGPPNMQGPPMHMMGQGPPMHNPNMQMPQQQMAPGGGSAQATYKVCCPLCATLLQVVLPGGVTSFQCAQCNAVFMVQPSAPQDGAAGKVRRKKKEKKDRPPRQPTPYNLFIKSELSKVKQEQPSLSHREAFRMASKRWSSSPKNPKCGEASSAADEPAAAAPAPAKKGADKKGKKKGGDSD